MSWTAAARADCASEGSFEFVEAETRNINVDVEEDTDAHTREDVDDAGGEARERDAVIIALDRSSKSSVVLALARRNVGVGESSERGQGNEDAGKHGAGRGYV